MVAAVAKPGSRAAGGPREGRGRRQVGAGTDEGEPPTFGAPSASPEPEPHSRAGVSTSTEGVGGRTAVSLGGLCAVLERNLLGTHC